MYHGKGIGTGNTVSFAENKGRRTWKPNVRAHANPSLCCAVRLAAFV